MHELIELSEQMQLEYAQKFVGQVLEVIPEGEAKGREGSGKLHGYSDNYIQLVFDGTPDMVGKVCRVKLTEAGANESQGTLVRVLEENVKPAAM